MTPEERNRQSREKSGHKPEGNFENKYVPGSDKGCNCTQCRKFHGLTIPQQRKIWKETT